MRYYTTSEISKDGKPTGRYHMTCQSGSGIWPVGYCASTRTCPECKGHSFMRVMEIDCARCANKGYIEVEPCPGHATPKEAELHFREYQADHAKYDCTLAHEQRPCRVCKAWTQTFVRLAEFESILVLCDAHRTRDQVLALLKAEVEAER